MKTWKPILCLIVAVAASGCSGGSGEGARGGAREVQINVTDNGFEPSEIEVKKGENITLVITRKTDQTCATEVVVADRGIRADLPLNQAVRVALGPVAGGEISYACGMDMIKGTVVVR